MSPSPSPLRWGFLGCGRISSDFATAIRSLDSATFQACAARSLKSAQDFAAQFGVASAYDSYEALCSDPAVDIVYVGTLHPSHFEHIWTTITPTILWRLRNRNVFDNLQTTTSEAASIVRAAGIYQVMTVANAWKSQPEKRILGYCLEACQDIMKITNTDEDPAELSMWLLQYHTIKLKGGGGWLVFKQENEKEWGLRAAGSVAFPVQIELKDYGTEIMKECRSIIEQYENTKEILLQVETRDRPPKRRTRPDTTKDRESREPHPADSFFAVQWIKPTRKSLSEAKFLARKQETKRYIVPPDNSTDLLPRLLKMVAMRQREPSIDTIRKTITLIDRLNAYQASIGKKN